LYLYVEEREEGHGECNQEDGEDDQHLEQGPQYLQEHYHVDAEEIEPGREYIKKIFIQIVQLTIK